MFESCPKLKIPVLKIHVVEAQPTVKKKQLRNGWLDRWDGTPLVTFVWENSQPKKSKTIHPPPPEGAIARRALVEITTRTMGVPYFPIGDRSIFPLSILPKFKNKSIPFSFKIGPGSGIVVGEHAGEFTVLHPIIMPTFRCSEAGGIVATCG